MHSARVPASYVLGSDIRATPSPSGFGCCACSAVERLQGMDVCRTGGSQSRVIAVYTLNLRGNETGLRGRVLSGRSLSSVGGAGNPPPLTSASGPFVCFLRPLPAAPPPTPRGAPAYLGPRGHREQRRSSPRLGPVKGSSAPAQCRAFGGTRAGAPAGLGASGWRWVVEAWAPAVAPLHVLPAATARAPSSFALTAEPDFQVRLLNGRPWHSR